MDSLLEKGFECIIASFKPSLIKLSYNALFHGEGELCLLSHGVQHPADVVEGVYAVCLRQFVDKLTKDAHQHPLVSLRWGKHSPVFALNKWPEVLFQLYNELAGLLLQC